MRHRILLVLGAAACARGGVADPDGAPGAIDARDTIDSDPAAPDAPPGGPADAAPPAPDATPGTPDAAPPMVGPHLLLTEVSLAPNEGELIEIKNPTAGTIDLTNYYVTDAPTYFRLPAGTHTVDTTDFLARFPAGASIPAGGVVTIAVGSAAAFQTNYGVAPTFAITGGTMIVQPPAATYNLTNGGEPVVLFRWDGASDLVTDVDIVVAGTPSAGNALVAKSAMALDGPDLDVTPTAYATDAMTIPNKSAPAAGNSTKRLMPETAYEVQLGTGNGVGGDDETSENTAVTWDGSGYTASTPGATPF
jgi:hypothetical protein